MMTGAGEELRAEHIRVIYYRNDAGLLVDVVRRRHAVATGDRAKPGGLHRLQLPPDDAGFDYRPPDAGGITVG